MAAKCSGCGKFTKDGASCSCGAKPTKEAPKETTKVAKKKAPSEDEIFRAADKVAKKLPIDKDKPALRKGFAEQLFAELDSDDDEDDF
jgi:hypothetical protein